MEVQAVNNHMSNRLLSPTTATTPSPPPPTKTTIVPSKSKGSTTKTKTAAASPAKAKETNSTMQIISNLKTDTSSPRHSSTASSASNSDVIEKNLEDLDLQNSQISNKSNASCSYIIPVTNRSNGSADTNFDSITTCSSGSNGSSNDTSTTNCNSVVPSNSELHNVTAVSSTNNMSSSAASITQGQIKKRISSCRTPTRKAKRVKFYRNGDRFHAGITIPVSNERYRSFESLFEDLTRLLEENVKIPGAVRTIYTMCGKKISTLEDFEDGQVYVCCCNNETFKKVEYNLSSQPLVNLVVSNKANNRLSKIYRPASPMKNGNGTSINSTSLTSNGSPLLQRLNERDAVVHPRIVTLIRNGTKPRRIMRLLLNKRNSPSFEHVLTAITQTVKLDTGYVRKVFTFSGIPVLQLADFFGAEDIFFAYGNERINLNDDLKLEAEEQRAMQAVSRKSLRTSSSTGPKPKMPVKSKNLRKAEVAWDENRLIDNDDQWAMLKEAGIDATELPPQVLQRFSLDGPIGDGNFAVVLKCTERETKLPFALKVIDKSKCKGKEHYIDAEVRVMKKLNHPNIISLVMDVDQKNTMYLVLEYVSGGDLFDAITRVTRFSEDQSRIMIRHLASALSYLHSMSIVHRDIKPENLLVKLDSKGNVVELKLGDFGLACEVTEPLYAVCGTPTYVAPEILMETGYGLKIDVWAAGIILYILLCGFPPFVAPDNEQEPLFDAIIAGVYEFPDPYWSDIGQDVRDLISNMLQTDPAIRFTSEDILDHFWTMETDTMDSDYSS